ncbi:MAG: MIP/aquaporin family protein [Pseudomonadota bacterium]
MQHKLMAEAVGTLLLLATIAGSGIMGEMLAGGQVGAALLPHALAIGAMLFVLITLLGPVSGAHFNPAVTMIFTLRGDLPRREAVPYVIVQILAAIAGVWLAHLMFDLDIAQASAKSRTGIGQWSAEVVATGGLIFVILGGLRQAPHLIPAMVGAYIFAGLWFTASTSFANPAVTIARMLTDTFTGIMPVHAPAFIAAQIVGALLGWQIANLIFAEDP